MHLEIIKAGTIWQFIIQQYDLRMIPQLSFSFFKCKGAVYLKIFPGENVFDQLTKILFIINHKYLLFHIIWVQFPCQWAKANGFGYPPSIGATHVEEDGQAKNEQIITIS